MKQAGLKEYLYEVVTGKRQGWTIVPVLFFLYILTFVYRALSGLHRLLAKKSHLPVPVISIGNIVAGGTGKTPTTVALARILTEKGKHPAILTRGYGGSMQEQGIIFTDRELSGLSPEFTGDEPYLMAQLLPGIPIVVGRDRVAMAYRALEEYPDIDLFLLDDGFQYWKLERDLDIVLIDALNPFDNGYVIPRGLLREPLTALKRADVIILTRWNQVTEESNRQLITKICCYNSKAPVIRAETDNSTFIPLFSDGETIAFTKAKPVAVVTAIGNPEQFKRAVAEAGVSVAFYQTFPDHHFWSDEEIQVLIEQLHQHNLQLLVTTAKDGVKLGRFKDLFREANIGCYILTLEFRFPQGVDGLEKIL
ncbi:MAG TPA: tetraacyldisaccharide 4'-kinase [Bacillota bacterium]|nr:tetraacyldisaccharide 4'-kinase [Bacillota bacterium]